jgi:hypothetical protein
VIEVLRHDANDTLLKDVPRPRIGVNDATPPAINKPLSTAAMIRDGVLARTGHLCDPTRAFSPWEEHRWLSGRGSENWAERAARLG